MILWWTRRSTAADTDVCVVAKVGDSVIARYCMGSNQDVGDMYYLVIPGYDGNSVSDGNPQPGGEVSLVISGGFGEYEAEESPYVFAAFGTNYDFPLHPVCVCTSDADCDDGIACTIDTCNLDTGECEYTPSDEL